MRATGPSTPDAATMGAPAPHTPAIRGTCRTPRPPCPLRRGGLYDTCKGGSPKLIRILPSHSHSWPSRTAGARGGGSSLGHQVFFGAHERRGRAHSGGVATRGTILRGHLTTGASWHGPGCSRRRVSRDTGSARARSIPLLTIPPGVDRLSCARARARHDRTRRGPTPQAAHPAPG